MEKFLKECLQKLQYSLTSI